MDPHCKLNVATYPKSLSLDTPPTKPMSLVNKVTSHFNFRSTVLGCTGVVRRGRNNRVGSLFLRSRRPAAYPRGIQPADLRRVHADPSILPHGTQLQFRDLNNMHVSETARHVPGKINEKSSLPYAGDMNGRIFLGENSGEDTVSKRMAGGRERVTSFGSLLVCRPADCSRTSVKAYDHVEVIVWHDTRASDVFVLRPCHHSSRLGLKRKGP